MCYQAPFNSDLVSEAELKRIVKKFEIKTIVETGTFKGFTTKELSKLVDEVYTVEISDEYYNRAK